MSDKRFAELSASLAAYGSDFSRWPLSARPKRGRRCSPSRISAAPGRRSASSTASLRTRRAELDGEIARAGAVERVAARRSARLAAGPLAGMRWRRIAAAVLIAGMLGGAIDLMLAERGRADRPRWRMSIRSPLDETDVQ